VKQDRDGRALSITRWAPTEDFDWSSHRLLVFGHSEDRITNPWGNHYRPSLVFNKIHRHSWLVLFWPPSSRAMKGSEWGRASSTSRRPCQLGWLDSHSGVERTEREGKRDRSFFFHFPIVCLARTLWIGNFLEINLPEAKRKKLIDKWSVHNKHALTQVQCILIPFQCFMHSSHLKCIAVLLCRLSLPSPFQYIEIL